MSSTSSPVQQRPRLASMASTTSSFSIISGPMSPVFVEPDSDDDEVVYPRSPSVGPLAGLRRYSSVSFSEIMDEDDIILISSPRTRTPNAAHATALVSPLSPLSAMSPRTPVLPRPTVNSLPTPSSTSSATCLPKTAAAPPVAKVTPVVAAQSKKSKSRKRRAANKAAGATTTTSNKLAHSKAAKAYPSPSPSPSPTPSPPTPTPQAAIGPVITTANHRTGRKRGPAVVKLDDDALYQAAVNYVSRYLEHPVDSDTRRLPLLQNMLIELGVCPPSGPVPQSVRAAKTMLRSQVLINVRDYLAARGQGVTALRKMFFPSKSQLLKDLRTRRVPLPWIKEHGLTMFLGQFRNKHH